jgi:carbon storage regulator
MLVLSRKIDERIMIGDQIEISIVDIKGDQVKIGIQAPGSVKVYRKEVYEAIQQENIEAARARPESLPDLDRLMGDKKKDKPLP